MASDLPAHFHLGKSGKLWTLLCLRCGLLIGAAPDPEILVTASERHECNPKKKPVASEAPDRKERSA